MVRKVVDFHAHAFHDKIAEKAAKNLENYYKIPLAGNGRFYVVTNSMKEHQIDKLVVHATATKKEQVEVINDYVAGLLTEDIIGFGTLHQDYEDFENELDRMKALGLRGIKFHPIFQGFKIDDEAMLPVYRSIAKRGLPVLMHMGDKNADGATPKRLAKVLDEVSDLIVVAAHLGGVFEWDEAEKHLYGRSNVYLDTSSAMRFMEPSEATERIRAHGTKRVLFGTDYPLSLHQYELEIFDKLELSEEEQEDILWKNAYRLLNL
ncbi:MAG: amidohydrolase family protein [Clostridia bacterium]|nr:amidohydrolase family protein [Clostridia bacterium]